MRMAAVSMFRPSLLTCAALLFLGSGCADRVVPVDFYFSPYCCKDAGAAARDAAVADGGDRGAPAPGTCNPACPLHGMQSLGTSIKNSSGALLASACVRVSDMCAYSDLARVQLIDGVSPAAGAEVVFRAYFDDDACAGSSYFECESGPGDYTVDLRSEHWSVPVWCECAPRLHVASGE